MIERLVTKQTQTRNAYPVKGGVSPYYSPNVIIAGVEWDYNKHCRIPFGAYVQALQENDPSNTLLPRTIDAIYLGPLMNGQGHEVMNLHTGRVCTRRKVTEIPVTPSVIKLVETMAYKQGFKCLKFYNRHGVELVPADLIAGVDYLDDEDEDDDYTIITSNLSDDDSDSDDEDSLPPDDFDPIEPDELEEPTTKPNQDYSDTPQPQQPARPSYYSNGPQQPARPKRDTKPPDRLTYHQTKSPPVPISLDINDPGYADMIGSYIDYLRKLFPVISVDHAQQYFLHEGLKHFGDRGEAGMTKEMKQQHDRTAFAPKHVHELTQQEIDEALPMHCFISEKRTGDVKGRSCADGRTQRESTTREESASPTVSQDAVMITAAIDALEGRDVMTGDIPNAFIQTDLPQGKKRILLKITGRLVDALIKIAPDVYKPYVTYVKGTKTLYVVVLKAIYGMLQSALLWYEHLRSDLESVGFVFNFYDACVCNRMVDGKQQTVRFHVDDLWSSHMDSKVNDDFLEWLNSKYGKYGPVKATRGKVHDYLGMNFGLSVPGKVIVDQIPYVQKILDECPFVISKSSKQQYPARPDLMHPSSGKPLPKWIAAEYHNHPSSQGALPVQTCQA